MQEQVEEWYLGAQQGDVAAQYNLGVSFLNGQGVKQDYVEAAKWFAKAAEGHDLDATYNLATCYMNGDGVEQDVKKVTAIIVDKLGVEPSEVTESASFTNDLGADSLDTVELLMEFEKVFGIKIPDEETAGIATVADAVAKVEEKLNA